MHRLFSGVRATRRQPIRLARCREAVLVAVAAAGVGLATAVPAQADNGIRVGAPVAPQSVHIDPRNLPIGTPRTGREGVEQLEIPGPRVPGRPQGTKPVDPLWRGGKALFGPIQKSTTPTEFANPVPNFDGLTRAQTGFRPPDTNGAVGPNHYIQIANAMFQVFRKDGTAAPGGGPFNINSLWATLPNPDPCRDTNIGDPYVLYDHLADRWVISQFARDGGGARNYECVAVSPGADPTAAGTWHLYTFNLGFSNDYPKLGVWPDGYYMVTQRGYNGNPVDVTVFDRANMLNGNPAGFQTASVAGPPTIIMLPSDLTGPAPPAGTPNFFVRPIDGDLFGGADRIEIREFHVDWGVPANTRFGVGAAHDPDQTLTPAGFSSDICAGNNLNNYCVQQPDPATAPAGTTNLLLEVLSVWPMGPLQFRSFGTYDTLVFNHSVDVNGAGLTGVRWYELRRSAGTWSIHQQGTFSPPDGLNIHRWMGSIAMDSAGNMALGYSVSNGSTVVGQKVYPGIRYAGRLATDPLGELSFGEVTLQAGAGRMLGPDDGFEARWGDYSAMRVDATDGCTFWYTSEYLPNNISGAPPVETSASWRTRIGAFRFPTCNPADIAITKTDAPDPVAAGAQLTYTIGVTNNGPADATNVSVTDTLPASVTLVTTSIPCSGTPLVCNIGNLANGASTSFTITVKVSSSLLSGLGVSATNITNTASVKATQLDPDTSNNTASASTLVTESADMRLTKTCKPDTPALAGTSAFCDIRVDNLGGSDARNVVVTDAITSNANFTVSSVTGATCAPGTPIGPTTSTTLTCNLGTVAAGAGTTIHVVFTTSSAGDINDTATVASTTPDPNTGNNSATGRVSFFASADLGITKGASPNPVVAGTNVTYTIAVSNAGPSVASNVVVKDTIPAEVAVLTVTPSVGSCTAGIPGNPLQPLTCTMDSMAVGGSATITVVARVNPSVPDGTVINNNATVSSAVTDSNNANNSATAAVTVNAKADLVITKTSDKLVYKPSVVITYTVSVTNNGPSDSLAVIVTDNLPTAQQAIYQSDTGGCVGNALSPTVLTCDLGNMPVGTTKSFNIYERINGSRGSVSNNVSVTSSTTDPNTANNSTVRTVTIGK
jgi:uncharacterized repeat protein (TIGR01451 family)